MLASQACKDAPTPLTVPQLGPDTAPPALVLSPGRDTAVDSTGLLTIDVFAHDQSWITSIQLVVINGPSVYPPVTPDTTDVAEEFGINLANFKHSTFRWYVFASDILNHQTVSDTVAVSVR